MPHVIIKMYPGRSPEVKKELCDKIADIVVETVKCPPEAVSVAIYEIPPESWEKEVMEPDILPAGENLYKAPGTGLQEEKP